MAIPPLSSLLKSTEVEDAINTHFHRPLAYRVVALVWRTRVSPDMITLFAMIVGMSAGVAWAIGTPIAMVVGGILLWSSAILDGADGLLARAKGIQSQFGRALDGSADAVVAVTSLAGAVYHIWRQTGDATQVLLAGAAIGTTLFHLPLYDYYKELYLRMTRASGPEGEAPEEVERKLAASPHEGLLTRWAVKYMLLPAQRNQELVVSLIDPCSARVYGLGEPDEEAAARYRRYNRGPMRAWALLSLAPHCYLLSVFAMFDRIDLYAILRLVGMNALLVVTILWQRKASRNTWSVIGVGSAATMAQVRPIARESRP